jgi:hypothetical protein
VEKFQEVHNYREGNYEGIQAAFENGLYKQERAD